MDNALLQLLWTIHMEDQRLAAERDLERQRQPELLKRLRQVYVQPTTDKETPA